MDDSTGVRILVVEDEDSLREFLVDTLRAQKYEVHSAAGGNEAWELLQSHPFDLLVTDSAMPEGNGFQLIRKLDQLGKSLPVLVLSGYLSLDENSAKKRGATAYLRKPATAVELISAVDAILRSHAA